MSRNRLSVHGTLVVLVFIPNINVAKHQTPEHRFSSGYSSSIFTLQINLGTPVRWGFTTEMNTVWAGSAGRVRHVLVHAVQTGMAWRDSDRQNVYSEYARLTVCMLTEF